MQGTAGVDIKRGYVSPKMDGVSNQDAIDRLAAVFVPSVLDVEKNREIIDELEAGIQYLVARLTDDGNRSEITFGLAANRAFFRIRSNDGFTQVTCDYPPVFTPDDLVGALGFENGLDRNGICKLERPPLCKATKKLEMRYNGRTTVSYPEYSFDPPEDVKFYAVLGEVASKAMEMTKHLRGEGNREFTLAHYMPGADIARAQRTAHHVDLVEGNDSVSRAITLKGSVEARVGMEPFSLETIVRSPGDEIALNYLQKGYENAGGIHDMTNVGDVPALNIVFMLNGSAGHDYLNSLGCFTIEQKQAMARVGESTGAIGRSLV